MELPLHCDIHVVEQHHSCPSFSKLRLSRPMYSTFTCSVPPVLRVWKASLHCSLCRWASCPVIFVSQLQIGPALGFHPRTATCTCTCTMLFDGGLSGFDAISYLIAGSEKKSELAWLDSCLPSFKEDCIAGQLCQHKRWIHCGERGYFELKNDMMWALALSWICYCCTLMKVLLSSFRSSISCNTTHTHTCLPSTSKVSVVHVHVRVRCRILLPKYFFWDIWDRAPCRLMCAYLTLHTCTWSDSPCTL